MSNIAIIIQQSSFLKFFPFEEKKFEKRAANLIRIRKKTFTSLKSAFGF
jgi:hypothetical protein